MVRKKHNVMVDLLEQGKPDRQIVKATGYSLKYIRNQRTQLKRQGIIPGGVRPKRPNGDGHKSIPDIRRPKQEATWSEIQEAILKTFEEAKSYEAILDENWHLRNINSTQQNQLKTLQHDLDECRKTNLAYQQGQLPKSLLNIGKEG